MIDPVADKLMMLVVYLTLTWLGALPYWLTAIVIIRDMIILSGAQLYRKLIEEPRFSASRIK